VLPVEEELGHLGENPIEAIEEVPTCMMDSFILVMETPNIFENEIDDILF
jgi:hypothetical protein